MGLQPLLSAGDAPWQPITLGGLEEGELIWEGLSPCSHTGQHAPKPPTMVRRRGQSPKSAFSARLLSAQRVGSNHAGLGLRVPGAVVKAGVSLLLAVL